MSTKRNILWVLMIFILVFGMLPVQNIEARGLEAPGECPCSIWPDPITPGFSYDNPGPIETGLKFRSDVSGTVTGVRFFKAADATGSHIGRLWSMTGVKLAEVTFTNETASGWQSANFPTPVSILPNTTYIISNYYSGPNATDRRFSDTFDYFAASGVDNGPLHALGAGVDGPNGIFSEDGGFCNKTYLSSNYWVDLIFTDVADTTPPTVSAVSPLNGTYGVLVSTNITAVFSENIDVTTINGTNFELRDSSNNLVPASVTYNPGTLTATLDPASNLTFSSIYTVRIVSGSSGVKDLVGNPLATDSTWSFTTEDTDTTRPTVVSVSPVNSATEVALSSNLSAIFSEAMDRNTINATNFVLLDAQNNLVTATISYDSGTDSASLDPGINLSVGTTYSARIKSGDSGVKDLAGNALLSDYTWSFTTSTPLAVASVKPINGASKLRRATSATAYFSRAINPASIGEGTFELRNPANQLVPAVVTYNSSDQSATLNPVSNLAYSTTYTARIVGGSSGVMDTNGIGLAADYTWTFSTEAQRSAVDQGPGGPILVITNANNLFTRYYAEILRTEGLNEFALADISTLSAETLTGYSIAILGEMPLTAGQVILLTDWVTGGGHLIAMRPDKQLAGLLGLTDSSSTLTNAYLQIDTSRSPGTGIVGQTLQFHGTADAYTLNGAESLAALFSDLTTHTSNPAVTLRSVGSSGGLAAAFTYDLARSIVYTHQGNPAWQDGQHVNPLQSYGTALDLFYDETSPWIDTNRIGIPQADEQQRFLANLILSMNIDETPLPRFWYFPSGKKAVIILTGDDHVGRGSPSGSSIDFFNKHIQQSPANCSAADWECIRSSSYGYVGNNMTDAQAAAYTAMGFEFGLHADAGLVTGGWCGTWPSDLANQYTLQYDALFEKYASLPVQSSERNHCYSYFGYTGPDGWHGYAGTPETEANLGIRLDTNQSFNPPPFATSNTSYNRGTGMPMRFAQVDTTGRMTSFLDIYNGGTQMTDDNGQGAATMRTIVDSYLDYANGSQGYYGAFVVNMHSDNWYGWSYAGSDQIVASAQAHGVPVVSGAQMVEWLDGRNSSSFNNITWDKTTLGFTVTVGTGARNLQAMLPAAVGAIPLSGILRNGIPVAFTTQTIKGVEYAFFSATAGSYSAVYTPDTTPPLISALSANPNTGQTATITWMTNELASSRIDYGTDPDVLSQNLTSNTLVSAHTLNLTGLSPTTQYFYRVSSSDASANTATSPALSDAPESFTTPSASFIDTTLADFSAGSPDANTFISQQGDGEVILAPVIGAEFSGTSLPSGWTQIGTGGTLAVNNGLLTLDGATVGGSSVVSSGHSVEAVATFSVAIHQHLGFGVNLTAGSGDAWAIISTGASGTGLFARSWNGTGAYTSETSTSIPGSFLGTPHRYRIDWGTNSIDYYVDGNKVATHTITISIPMRPIASDSALAGPTLSVDWLYMSPYQAAGEFTSRVFDTLGSVESGNIAWNVDSPSGTGVVLSIRTGDSAVPDGSWTAFTPLSSGSTIGSGFRYIQYRANLTTGDVTLTPALRDVTILFNRTPDTTPPTVTGRSPAPGATGIGLNTDIQVQFSEPMNAATITNSTIRLRPAGGLLDVPATVSYAGLTATLHPTSPLAITTIYQVTVDGSVADVSNNPLGSDVSWTFTTVATGSFTDDNETDFGTGAFDDNTYLSLAGNGEVILKPAAAAEFSGSSLSAGWEMNTFSAGGSATVSNGLVTLDGARVGTTALFNPGVSIEGVATFRAAPFQHFGFGVTFGVDGTPWMIISTGSNGDGLYARSYSGVGDWQTETRTPIPGSFFGVPHRFRVDWFADHIVYYVDGNVVATHNISISTPSRPLIADSTVGGLNLSLDWLHLSPYPSSGTFTSRIFDAGQTVQWTDLSHSMAPTGTAFAFATQTSLDGISWSDWHAVNSPIASPNGRYLRYQVTLSTTDSNLTPILEDVTLSYTNEPTAVLLSSFSGAAHHSTVRLNWETANEVDLIGFNLYRSETPGGVKHKLNGVLVQAQKSGQMIGAVYQFNDEVSPGKRYCYWLELISRDRRVISEPLVLTTGYPVYLPLIKQ